MSKMCRTYYKTCRETAGLTQEQASEMLGVCIRQLSDYENDKAKVPEDIVEQMADSYKTPLLAYWHLKYHSPLGRFLPELQEPVTNGDMAFQMILARDDLSPTVESIKRILADGLIDKGETEQFESCIKEVKRINNKLFSVVVFAENIKKGGKHD